MRCGVAGNWTKRSSERFGEDPRFMKRHAPLPDSDTSDGIQRRVLYASDKLAGDMQLPRSNF